MAASHTTNLNLNKPARTDGVSVVSDINDNMDIIDQAYGVQNQNIANVNSDANQTTDILTDALSVTGTKFFKASGSSYTGTLPNSNYKYGVFEVYKRNSTFFVKAISSQKEIAVNYRGDGGTWSGWEEIALNSHVGNLSNLTTTEKGSLVGAANELNSKIAKYGDLGISTETTSSSATSAELNTGTFTFGLLVGYYRSDSNQERSGYAIVYRYNNTAYISAKTGLSAVTGVSYDNNKLTVSSAVGYMTYAFIKLL